MSDYQSKIPDFRQWVQQLPDEKKGEVPDFIADKLGVEKKEEKQQSK